MSQVASLLTPEVLAQKGRMSRWWTAPEPLERGTVRRFAEAIMDQNPLYRDRDYAQRAGFPDVLAPPTYVVRYPYGGFEVQGPFDQMVPVEVPGCHKMVHGGTELELFRPLQVGDVASQRTRIRDIYERQGRTGPMLFVIRETVYVNQHRQVLALARQINILLP